MSLQWKLRGFSEILAGKAFTNLQGSKARTFLFSMRQESTRKNKYNNFYRNDKKMKQKKLCPGQGESLTALSDARPQFLTNSRTEVSCLEQINLNRGKIRYKAAGNL